MTDVIPNSCPEEVLASIVWYPDQLDDARRGIVEAHVADCAACRAELEFVHGTEEPEIDLPDPDRVYAQLLERIERHEGVGPGARTTTGLAEPPRDAPALAPRRGRRGFGVPPAALAAGVALALLFGVAGTLGGLWLGSEADSVYATVTEVAEPVPAAAAQDAMLDVVFRAEASAERIHSALRAIGGQIVAGPTQLGVYRVRLAPTADVTAAARVLRGEGQGVATFAEPAPR